jgi:hypothetical protein
VIRALMIVAVTALLALPMLSVRGHAEPDPTAATADAICLDHLGVHSTTRELVTCSDGALHRWNGAEVQHRIPVLNPTLNPTLNGAAGSP